MDVRALREVVISAGQTTVVDVHVSAGGHEDGQLHPVLVERVQRHPASGQVLHVDLHQVNLNKPVHAAIPVVATGDAPAVKTGGNLLLHPLDTIEVEALPRALPQQIEVDVSGLKETDDQITVGDLRLPAGVTALTDPETVVIKVVASKLEQEVEAEAAEAAEAAAEAEEAAEPAAEAEGEAAAEEGGAAPEAREES
jgi:large subunit ribosomal protein L25